jgi:hypothetical protein
MNSAPTSIDSAMEAAAQALHSLTEAHYSVTMPDARTSPWSDLSEQARRSYLGLAQKASEADSFEDFYAFTTMAERLAGLEYPAAEEDTERSRGAKAQYHLVQHLTRIEREPIPSEARTSD